MKVRARWAAILLLGAVGLFVLTRSPRVASETEVELTEVGATEEAPATPSARGKAEAKKAARGGEPWSPKARAANAEVADEMPAARAVAGAEPVVGAQNGSAPPVPQHMLATPEEARLLPAVPTVYGPLKVSPELARQYAEEREQRYALALDTILSREQPDPEAAMELEEKAESGLHLLKKVTEIGVPEIDCGEALCRLTFDFDSAEAQRRAFPLLRGIGLATGSEAWVKPPNKSDNFELLVYVGRGGRLPITEDG